MVSGGPVGGHSPIEILPGDRVIAADSGLDVAMEWGWPVDVLVGDLDSVSAHALALAELDGSVVVERHPVDKDEVDLELALARAVADGATELVIIATATGRLDHAIATFAVLAADRWAPLPVVAHVDGAVVTLVRGGDRRDLDGRAGDLVSLVAFNGPAAGVTTAGLAYPLHGETLGAGSARGVSNVFVGDRASVAVTAGVLLVIQPA